MYICFVTDLRGRASCPKKKFLPKTLTDEGSHLLLVVLIVFICNETKNFTLFPYI